MIIKIKGGCYALVKDQTREVCEGEKYERKYSTQYFMDTDNIPAIVEKNIKEGRR
jgi:hypothetical protein